MATQETPPRTGNDPLQLANFSLFSGIGGLVLSLTTCVPFLNLCTCFLAPLGGIAAIVMSIMVRNQLGPEATGLAADRARYGLYLGIAALAVVVGILALTFILGVGASFLDTLQNF